MDQIDWLKLTGYDECTVVIAPVLLRELERKKINASSRKFKQRCDKTIKFLSAKMEESDPIPLRQSVALMFRDQEPLLDFSEHRLSEAVDDDHYIASGIELESETGKQVFIASGDTGLKMKLRSRSIDILELPNELRLPEEPDDDEKARRADKAELERLRNSLPTLSLGGLGDKPVAISVFREIIPDTLPTNEEMLKYPPRKAQTDFVTDESLRGLVAYSNLINEKSAERWNMRREKYESAYETWLDQHKAWLARIRKIESLRLALTNEGCSIATDVDVHMFAPPGIRFLDRDNVPVAPELPDPPDSKRQIYDPLDYIHNLTSPRISYDQETAYADDNGKGAILSVPSVKPGMTRDLPEIFIEIEDDALIGQPIQFATSISCVEREPQEARIEVRIDDGGIMPRKRIRSAREIGE
ncbi:PIN domain-containing protein [Erythrobacter rubeus]|uniref:PIN domain-containing protein n=1 Tax=Erythrobacter rubeus TaxID=2760803 RepID=A0ABR8KM10_9SPHN|nr:PIN domain-containing protein [Erythrobacter rubeus]MBD2841502.1 hypothetical protein [Erythrobacter rubeus]